MYEGMDQGSNPYEQAERLYRQPPVRTLKRDWVPGLILSLMGGVFLFMGALIALLGYVMDRTETDTEIPTDLYWAYETDLYSSVKIQYMSERVAHVDNTGYYIVCDRDWNMAVICIERDDLEKYQPYIDWFYSESYEDEPMELTVTGYAKPFDAELADFVIEGVNNIFEEGMVDKSNFVDYFGEYYLEAGTEAAEESQSYRGIAVVGIALIAMGAILLIIGVLLLCLKTTTETYGNPKKPG